jgi:hypothetical protein
MLHFTWLAIWLAYIQKVTAAHPLTLGPQGVNLWRLDFDPRGSAQLPASRGDTLQTSFKNGLGTETVTKKYDFRAQWFEQPLDHFDKTSKHRFHQRYWVNSRHYKPREGAPVIVLDGGETSGEVCCIAEC